MRRLLVLAMMLLAPSLAQAQYVTPDDRYKGYPAELVQWMPAPPTPEQLAACLAGEYYEPADASIAKYADRVEIAGYRVTQVAECRWTLTAHSDPALRWRLALRPPGTKIAVDAKGRDLFDFGTVNGVVCKNPSPYGWPVNLPPPAAVIVPISVQIEEGKYTPKYEEPEVPVAVIVSTPEKKGGWLCSGKKGILCAAVAACVIGQVANQGFCGIKIGGDNTPPVIPPPPVAPPPPSITPPKPPG